MFLGVGLADDRSHILIARRNQETSEVRLIPAGDPTAAPLVVEPRREGLRYGLEPLGRPLGDPHQRRRRGGLQADGLRRGRARRATTWRDWIAHTPGRLIAGVAAYQDHLVRLERENAIDRI